MKNPVFASLLYNVNCFSANNINCTIFYYFELQERMSKEGQTKRNKFVDPEDFRPKIIPELKIQENRPPIPNPFLKGRFLSLEFLRARGPP